MQDMYAPTFKFPLYTIFIFIKWTELEWEIFMKSFKIRIYD